MPDDRRRDQAHRSSTRRASPRAPRVPSQDSHHTAPSFRPADHVEASVPHEMAPGAAVSAPPSAAQVPQAPLKGRCQAGGRPPAAKTSSGWGPTTRPWARRGVPAEAVPAAPRRAVEAAPQRRRRCPDEHVECGSRPSRRRPAATRRVPAQALPRRSSTRPGPGARGRRRRRRRTRRRGRCPSWRPQGRAGGRRRGRSTGSTCRPGGRSAPSRRRSARDVDAPVVPSGTPDALGVAAGCRRASDAVTPKHASSAMAATKRRVSETGSAPPLIGGVLGALRRRGRPEDKQPKG